MFQCADCGEKELIHWTARARRTRVRCSSCGSLRLDPVTKEGHEDLAAETENLRVGLKRGSVIPGGGLSIRE